jgi:hypothetical protein
MSLQQAPSIEPLCGWESAIRVREARDYEVESKLLWLNDLDQKGR